MTRSVRSSLCSASGLMLVLLTGGCGGGGGGTVASTPPPPVATPTPAPTPTPPVSQPTPIAPTPTPTASGTSEYQRSAGVVQANAVAAYDRGITGSGVIAGIVDSGIDAGSAEFAGRISTASLDLAGSRGLQDEDGHGTAVAAVLGAARNDAGILGIAYDSTLLVLRTDTPGTCAATDGCKHSDATIARAIDVAIGNRARVINISLGGDEAGSATFRAAIDRATAAGIVVVMAAGNEPTANPDAFALIASDNTVARGLVVVAGASNAAGDIADFSARAGSAGANYLLALGERVRAFDQTGTAFLYSGTSFSAPLISGAVALLAQAFPNLTGRQIVDILYATATDLGTAGVDATYGRGRLDLAQAFQPRGTTTLAGSSVAVATTDNGLLSAAMGDAGRSGQVGQAVMLDGYGRAYRLDIGRTLSRIAPASRLLPALAGGSRNLIGTVPGGMVAVTIASRGGDVAIGRLTLDGRTAQAARATAGMVATRIDAATVVGLGFAQGSGAVSRAMTGQGGSPFLVASNPREVAGFLQRTGSSAAMRHAIAGAGVTLTAEQGDVLVTGIGPVAWRQRYDSHGYTLAGVAFDRRVGPLTLAAGVSRMNERATVLGGRFSAALGGGGARSDFIDLSTVAALGADWTLTGAWRQGRTRGRAGGAALTGARLRSTGWSVDLARTALFGLQDRIALRIAQPLRVASGGINLTLPVAYDYVAGVTATGVSRLNLAPDGRELDVEGSFGQPLLGGWVTANLYYRRQPGHYADAGPDIGTALRYAVAF